MRKDEWHRSTKKRNGKNRTLYEACAFGRGLHNAKPGLVDLQDNGAHQDMDYRTFEKSTCAIVPYMGQMYEEGARWTKDPELLFAK